MIPFVLTFYWEILLKNKFPISLQIECLDNEVLLLSEGEGQPPAAQGFERNPWRQCKL